MVQRIHVVIDLGPSHVLLKCHVSAMRPERNHKKDRRLGVLGNLHLQRLGPCTPVTLLYKYQPQYTIVVMHGEGHIFDEVSRFRLRFEHRFKHYFRTAIHVHFLGWALTATSRSSAKPAPQTRFITQTRCRFAQFRLSFRAKPIVAHKKSAKARDFPNA